MAGAGDGPTVDAPNLGMENEFILNSGALAFKALETRGAVGAGGADADPDADVDVDAGVSAGPSGFLASAVSTAGVSVADSANGGATVVVTLTASAVPAAAVVGGAGAFLPPSSAMVAAGGTTPAGAASETDLTGEAMSPGGALDDGLGAEDAADATTGDAAGGARAGGANVLPPRVAGETVVAGVCAAEDGPVRRPWAGG